MAYWSKLSVRWTYGGSQSKQSRKSAPAPELAALRAELRDAQSELALAYRQFDQATAPELVEACIYRISAAKARCDYYLRVLKAQEPEAAGSPRGCALRA
ncbi:MAG: DUF2508 domain-containing protein [Oscillospiraceae bacterium]